MARETTIKCDICKKPTTEIVGKLFFGPMIPGSARAYHSNYTHHCDVGVCCREKLLRGFSWRQRIFRRKKAKAHA